jgi:Flp pilus assembly protein TadG
MKKSPLSNSAWLGAICQPMTTRAAKLCRSLRSDISGVAAIEFCIIAPVFILLIAGGITLGQLQQQNLSAQFLSIVGAMASANYAQAQSVPPSQVQAQVIAMLQANEATMIGPGTSMSIAFAYPPAPSGGSSQTQVTITLSSSAYFPLFGDTLSSTQNATQ